MASLWRCVTPVPCHHIAAYYQLKWESHKCIAWNFLRRGYAQWAFGNVEPANNLYGESNADH